MWIVEEAGIKIMHATIHSFVCNIVCIVLCYKAKTLTKKFKYMSRFIDAKKECVYWHEHFSDKCCTNFCTLNFSSELSIHNWNFWHRFNCIHIWELTVENPLTQEVQWNSCSTNFNSRSKHEMKYSFAFFKLKLECRQSFRWVMT